MRMGESPDVILAPQALINCDGGGTCNGGYIFGVYDYIRRYGVPEETCQNYVAKDLDCKPLGTCAKCEKPITNKKTVNYLN